MDRTTDETDVIVEEYEEVIGNLNELSDRVEMEDTEAESIQEPTSVDRRNMMTHTGRPSLRSTNARLYRKPRRVETSGRHKIYVKCKIVNLKNCSVVHCNLYVMSVAMHVGL